MCLASGFWYKRYQAIRMEVVMRPTSEAAADLVAHIIARELRKNPRLVFGLATGKKQFRPRSTTKKAVENPY